MTTLHARSKPALSTDDLRQRTGQPPRPTFEDYCAKADADCEAAAKRKRRRELRIWFYGCLAVWALLALVWRLW